MCKSGAIDAMGLLGPQGDSSIEFNRRRDAREEAFNGSGDGVARQSDCRLCHANQQLQIKRSSLPIAGPCLLKDDEFSR